MSNKDDKKSQEDRRTITRRRFFQTAGFSACAIAAGGAAVLGENFLEPRALFEPPTRFLLGAPESIAPGAVIMEEAHQVYVMRFSDGFRAISAVCTHLGCITRYQPDDNCIACPCHGSRFSLDGEVMEGPAPRALPWLRVDLTASGRIAVDTAEEVSLGTVFKL